MDDRRRKQQDLPPRAEAIRRLVDRGIGVTATHPRSKESKARWQGMKSSASATRT
jgi:hypothetical protein